MMTLLQYPCEGVFGQCIGPQCPAYDECWVDEEDEEE
jgi:hypothetical protein